MSYSVRSALRSFGERVVPGGTKDWLRKRIAGFVEGDIVTYRELAACSDVRCWQFGTERTFELTPPAYANELPEEIARILGKHTAHAPFVLEVPNVELVGRQGLLLTPESDFVVYNFWDHDSGRASLGLAYDILDGLADATVPIREPPVSVETAEIDLAVPLVSKWATNYNHWTEEYLPQFEGIRHYVEQTGEEPTLVIPPDAPEFIRESIGVIGYDPAKVRKLTEDRLRVHRMVLPSPRRCLSATSDDYMRDPSGLNWIREVVLENIEDEQDAETPSKLLISRQSDATERRIVNWNEVESTLSERGFAVVELTGRSFSEQVRLFAQADVVVGTHGAGLTGIVYANDANVVELFGSHFVSVYFEMASEMGLSYASVKCTPSGDDIVVDVDELTAALDAVSGERVEE